MPLPKPSPNQKESDFHSACMSNEVMKKEFPDMKQRNAVCFNLFKKSRQAKGGLDPNFDDFDNKIATIIP